MKNPLALCPAPYSCVDSRNLVLWNHDYKTRGAPHVGALLFFEGQNTRFRPIFSAIPRGAFFLNFSPKSTPDGPDKGPILIRNPTAARGGYC
jgi:hypothetical protein